MKQYDPMKLRKMIVKIQDELKKLDKLLNEWESHLAGDWTDTIFRRSKASVFHDFYCGVESIFKRIAPELNGGLPNDPEWQTILLQNMLLEIPEVRPPVVSAETGKFLKTFLDFRHKFRQIYGFELDPEKMQKLDRLYAETHKKFCEDIAKFIDFLNALIAALEKKSSGQPLQNSP